MPTHQDLWPLKIFSVVYQHSVEDLWKNDCDGYFLSTIQNDRENWRAMFVDPSLFMDVQLSTWFLGLSIDCLRCLFALGQRFKSTVWSGNHCQSCQSHVRTIRSSTSRLRDNARFSSIVFESNAFDPSTIDLFLLLVLLGSNHYSINRIFTKHCLIIKYVSKQRQKKIYFNFSTLLNVSVNHLRHSPLVHQLERHLQG